MKNRLFSVAVLATGLLTATSVFAAKDAAEVTHDGKLVSMTKTEFVMSVKKGKQAAKEMTHTLSADVKVMLDGKSSKLADLKAGMKIRVSTHADDAKVATMIEAIDKNTLFANTHDGKIVSISSKTLVMSDKDGKEHSHSVSAETKVCCDGEDCKITDLKTGMRIRVTSHRDDQAVVVGIEALDKDAEFASL
jgi:hypothetical protein